MTKPVLLSFSKRPAPCVMCGIDLTPGGRPCEHCTRRVQRLANRQ